MKSGWMAGVALGVLLGGASQVRAEELKLQLNGPGAVRQKVVQYACDASAAGLGLTAGTFPVTYVNGAGNSLAVIRVRGVDLVFANVLSGSGARYAAGPYVWWEGRETTFSSTMGEGKQAVCHEVKGGR